MQLKSVGRITLLGEWIGISSAVRKVWLPSSIDDDAVVRHLPPQLVEEARGIDDACGIVAIPALAIGGLIGF